MLVYIKRKERKKKDFVTICFCLFPCNKQMNHYIITFFLFFFGENIITFFDIVYVGRMSCLFRCCQEDKMSSNSLYVIAIKPFFRTMVHMHRTLYFTICWFDLAMVGIVKFSIKCILTFNLRKLNCI